MSYLRLSYISYSIETIKTLTYYRKKNWKHYWIRLPRSSPIRGWTAPGEFAYGCELIHCHEFSMSQNYFMKSCALLVVYQLLYQPIYSCTHEEHLFGSCQFRKKLPMLIHRNALESTLWELNYMDSYLAFGNHLKRTAVYLRIKNGPTGNVDPRILDRTRNKF